MCRPTERLLVRGEGGRRRRRRSKPLRGGRKAALTVLPFTVVEVFCKLKACIRVIHIQKFEHKNVNRRGPLFCCSFWTFGGET